MLTVVGGASVLGHSHLKLKKKNQDNILVYQDEKLSLICVSDGHGSEAYFRSDIGSKIAVDVVKQIIDSFLISHSYLLSDGWKFNVIEDLELIELKKNIIGEWQKQVLANSKNNPFDLIFKQETTIHDLNNNELKESYVIQEIERRFDIKQDTYNKLIHNPIIAYGATLLCYAQFNGVALIIQIGDGDIVFSDKEGAAILPISIDITQFANETNSLCQLNFENLSLLRVCKLPEIVTISTDGVFNSFSDDETYKKIGNELLNTYVSSVSNEIVIEELESFLKNLSKKGSGDDCSVTYLFNIQEENKNKTEISDD